MQNLAADHSGDSGVLRLGYQSAQASISVLPPESEVEQRVKLLALDQEYLFVESEQLPTVKNATAAQFDRFIEPIFGNIKNVARDVWPEATRWRAINEAMHPERRQKNLPYVRRDKIADGQILLRVIEPVEPDDTIDRQ